MAKSDVRNVTLTEVVFFAGPSQRVLCRMPGTNTAQMIVVVGGLYQAFVDTDVGRQRIRAEAGDVVVWPPRTVRTEESEKGRPLRCINIFFRWPRQPRNLSFLVRDANHVIDLLAHRLLDLSHDPVRKGMLGADSNAYMAAMCVEFMALSVTAADDLLARVIQYTEEHMQNTVRLDDLARFVGFEKHHFARKYRQLTGRTPIHDVWHRKALRARRQLLLNPEWTLAYVAPLVGMRDASALSRLLTRYAGASVRDIKRAARNKNKPRTNNRKGKGTQGERDTPLVPNSSGST
jgi:AraC-like DNA-binding protein